MKNLRLVVYIYLLDMFNKNIKLCLKYLIHTFDIFKTLTPIIFEFFYSFGLFCKPTSNIVKPFSSGSKVGGLMILEEFKQNIKRKKDNK